MKKNKKIINFLNKKIEETESYKELEMDLKIEEHLDSHITEAFAEMTKEFSLWVRENIEKTNENLLFKIYTDLKEDEMDFVADWIINTFIDGLIETKTKFKTEKIYGTLVFGEFDKIDISFLALMDLLNYPLKTESFNIEIYDKNRTLYKTLVM